MSRKPGKQLSRRDVARLLTAAGAALPFAGGISPLYPLLNPKALAQGSTPRRFLQIFLQGGWDSILATDPAVPGSAKATGGKYQPAYYTSSDSQYPGASVTVSGKSNLVVGPGLANAAAAFAQVPTAFVNGIFIEVTAHELATNYVYSGVPSLSRSREYPAIVATMADKSGGFPAHVILGGPIPLSTTKIRNPPLQTGDTDSFVKMLAGPYKSFDKFKPETIDAAHTLLSALNGEYQRRLPTNARAGLIPWTASEAGLPALYAKRYDQRMGLTDQLRSDFAAGTDAGSPGAKLALALQTLAEGISSFVTVNFDGFDTHRSHLSTHLPLLKSFATSLGALLTYMTKTADPDSPSLKLIETTTILVSSEFVRTPLFNSANGTDHWQSASAIVMGRGIKDNTIIGSTASDGSAANYGSDKLLPDHLAASLLRMMGFTDEADLVSGVNLSALFS